MKIQNEFAQMQTSENFIKTVEFRKENSISKVLSQNMTTQFGSGNYVITNGNLIADMEVTNCSHYLKNREYVDNKIHGKDCKYKLIFNGYQRIKLSELFEWLDNIIAYSLDNEQDLDDVIINELFEIEYNENLEFPIWFKKNLTWLLDFKIGDLIDEEHYIPIFENYDFLKDYLKDEEYCIVYFVDKAETFKVNGWVAK